MWIKCNGSLVNFDHVRWVVLIDQEEGSLRFRFRIWNKAEHCFEDNPWISGDGSEGWCYRRMGDGDDGIGFGTGDNWIIQQSTGLSDKNGKEIFEGDVLAVADLIPEESEPANYAVRFGRGTYDSGYYVYQGFYLENAREDDATGGLLFEAGRIAVIGNIFETPELLK